jgi:hypothetical protein
MTDSAPRDFAKATYEFLRFLKQSKVANQVYWIFPEDIALADGRFYIRTPVPDLNLVRASVKYSEGLDRGLGIELSVVCWIEDCAYSTVYVPADERDAELHLMPFGLPTRLKLSYPSRGGWNGEPERRDDRREAVAVRNRFKWSLVRHKGAKSEEMKAHLFD